MHVLFKIYKSFLLFDLTTNFLIKNNDKLFNLVKIAMTVIDLFVKIDCILKQKEITIENLVLLGV